MRTQIVIDDVLMQQAMRLTNAASKREVVDQALRLLVAQKQQAEILALRGAVTWEGDLDAMREADFADR